MANKVMFGLKNVHVAFLTESTGVYATPVAIPGAVKLSLEPEGDATEFFADNIKYFTASSNQGYTGDIEMALVPDDVLVSMLGWDVDDSGMLVELADGAQQPFALLFEVEGNDVDKRYVYYKCTAARPKADHATKTNSLEPTTQALSITVVPVEIDDVTVVKGSIENTVEDAAVYDAWYDAVLEPAFTAVS